MQTPYTRAYMQYMVKSGLAPDKQMTQDIQLVLYRSMTITEKIVIIVPPNGREKLL